MRFLFLLFVLTPIVEMWVLIKVGAYIGALSTIGLVTLTAFIGITLLRQQGLSTLWRAQQRMDSGQLPAQEMAEGLLLAVGGALLLTPGFVTDTVGFACLLPGLRQGLVARVAKHFVAMQTGPGARSAGREAPRRPDTIDGEFHRDD